MAPADTGESEDQPPAVTPTARRLPAHRIAVSRRGRPADPRFSFANERTFLAWNRTALSMIVGGLVAAQLLEFGVTGLREVVALPLIALGAVIGTIGFARWRANEIRMRLRKPLPAAGLGPALVGLSVGAVSLIASVVLLIDQLRP